MIMLRRVRALFVVVVLLVVAGTAAATIGILIIGALDTGSLRNAPALAVRLKPDATEVFPPFSRSVRLQPDVKRTPDVTPSCSR